MIIAAAEIAHPDYVPETWHLYLTFLLLLIIQGCLAMNSTKFLGCINIIGTIANVLVLVIFIIWLPVSSINRPKYDFSLVYRPDMNSDY
jgi:amino acid transporter